LHALPRPESFVLPNEDILGRVESRVSAAPISTEDRHFLLSLLTELKNDLNALDFPLDPAPTHGDAHSENIMISDGEAVLIDFERFAWGQPEWDLAMTATEYRSAGWWSTVEYQAFVDAYGYDVMSWTDGFDVLQRVHELKMTTWLMQNINESAEIADEYRVRMRTIRSGVPAAWRPF
jgi:thiamine kinase-like enzyme